MTIRKMDHDRDGKVSLLDFKTSVKNNNLLMEAFGSCLPSDRRGLEFKNSILNIRD